MNIEIVTNKIQKLIKLSKSNNENEAKLALERAQKLAIDFDLDINEIQIKDTTKQEPIENIKVFEFRRQPVIWKFIEFILQDYFDIRVIYSGNNVKFIGKPSKVEHAKLIAEYLLVIFDTLWKNYKKENNLTNKDKYSYMSGLKSGIESRLIENKKKVIDEKAIECSHIAPKEELVEKYNLILLNESKKIDAAVFEFYPKLRTKTHRVNALYDINVASDGYNNGRNINLSGNKVAGYLN